MSDYYNILEITKDATEEEIKMSYKKLAKKFHPDKNRDNQEEATSKFKLISEAYQVLNDAVMREAYDRNGKEKNVFWNIENFCFNRFGRNNDFEDCDIDTFLNPYVCSKKRILGNNFLVRSPEYISWVSRSLFLMSNSSNF